MTTPTLTPRFEYHLVECDDLAGLLSGQGRQISEADLRMLALEHGRVLLQARGGAGKTSMLRRLAIQRGGRGRATFHTARALIRGIAATSSSALIELRGRLDELVEDDEVELLLIDGLSEIADELGALLLRGLEDLTFRRPDLGVVVADRITKRNVLPGSWQLVGLTPVSVRSIIETLGADVDGVMLEVLQNPYYLELARASQRGRTRSEIESRRLERAGLQPDQLKELAAATARHYGAEKNRHLTAATLTGQVQDGTIRQMRAVGLLDAHGEVQHHLLADYLAASAFAGLSSSWNRTTFDLLSFGGASMEAIIMLGEQVASDRQDLFLRRVHDWNFYASAYVLVSARNAAQHVSAPVEVVLLAMLAEKRFDRIRASVDDASNLLAAHPAPLARRLEQVDTWAELGDAVRQQQHDAAWYPTWQSLFVREPGTAATDDEVALIASNEGVVGWTASNVLRRLELTEPQWRHVSTLAKHKDPVVRWRATHVMGGHAAESHFTTLASLAVSDEHAGVRHGSVRSLIELAAMADERGREAVFREITENAEILARDPAILAVVERDLRVEPTPVGWADATGILVESLWALSPSVEGQDRWRRLAQMLRDDEATADSEETETQQKVGDPV
jgi:hypothetical protein